MKGANQFSSPEQRFWQKVDRRGPDECWPWIGGRPRGEGCYGGFQIDGKPVRAHRFSFELHKGPIPDGLVIDHLCLNKLCVNPRHLEAVTLGENTQRWYALQTHCKNGHELTDRNTAITRRNHRRCRRCAAIKQAEYARKQKIIDSALSSTHQAGTK